MELTISIVGADGTVKARASGTEEAKLVYAAAYEEGDVICLDGSQPGYVAAKLEDSMGEVLGWLSGQFRLMAPFGEKRVSYSPRAFTGGVHLLQARAAGRDEVSAYRNLALNPLDSHENSGLFPHASANVETRGESVFAARNAIDGCYANDSHGPWPYQSWGINRDPTAELRLDFGRAVLVDEICLTLRADFPHDSWWEEAAVEFSDGSREALCLKKEGLPQAFPVAPRKIEWLILKDLKKAPDISPFPALTQIEVYGTEIFD